MDDSEADVELHADGRTSGKGLQEVAGADVELDFTLSGRRFRKKRRDFIEAVRGREPKPLVIWAVDIDGKRFGPKQVVACTTGFNDFTTQQANHVLRRFGFEPFGINRDRYRAEPSRRSPGSATVAEPDHQSSDARLTALREAIRFAATRPECTAEEVLRAADKFAAWLAAGGQKPAPEP